MMINPPPQSPRPGFSPAAGLGLQLAVGMAVFAGGGYWLDQKRGGGVGFTLAGVALGLVYCGYECWKVIRQLDQEPPNQTNDANKRDHLDRR